MRSEKKKGRIVVMLVAGLVLAVQFLSLASASSSWRVCDLPSRIPVMIATPTYPPGDPPGIPDSPFIENVASKYSYLIMLTEAYGSSPGNWNWNPKVDLNDDGVVDMCDAIIVAWSF